MTLIVIFQGAGSLSEPSSFGAGVTFAPQLVDSMGCGNGGWSMVPWGYGPYLTFPHTPTYSYAQELAYSVSVNQFEDLSEQRYLLSRERGVALTYEFQSISSGEVGAVTSFYIAMNGPLLEFLATDHRTSRPYVVRFQDTTFGTLHGAALRRAIPPFVFKSTRLFTLGELIEQDAPVGWWRLGDATYPTIAASVMAESVVDTTPAYHKNVLGITGMLDEEEVPRAGFYTPQSGSFTWVGSGPGGWEPLNAVTVEALFRTSYVASNQVIVQRFDNNSKGYMLEVQQGGALLWSRRASQNPTLATPQIVSDNMRHHVVARHDTAAGFVDIWLDGFLAASAATGALAAFGTAAGGLAIGAWFANCLFVTDSGRYFSGALQDVAVYSATLPVQRIQAHYLAVAGL